MRKTILRILSIAVILTAGVYAVFKAPKAVESFLPKVDTINLIKAEFCETVSGAGTISKSGEDWFVKVFIGERDIRKVKIEQSADLSGAAFDDGVYSATVTAIESSATRKQGEYAYETVVEVTLQIDNPDEELRSGYTARAEIKTEQERHIFIVPYSVICQDDTGEYVYVLSGNSAVRRDILTGAELSDGVEVVKGLGEKDEIISVPENVEDNKLVAKK